MNNVPLDGERRPLLPGQHPCNDGECSEANTLLCQTLWDRFRQPSPLWIILIYTLYVICNGTLIVPEFNTTLALICHQRYSSGLRPGRPPDDLLDELAQCTGSENAQSELSRFFIFGQVISGILGAISTPILGSLSDRFGRKPVLACSALGPLLADAIILLALRHPDSVDVRWLLVGYAVDGLSGTVITATSTSQAYITDLTHPSNRATPFSYLQASLSAALAFGPMVAAVLLTTLHSLEVVYRIAFCVHLSLVMLFIYVLPESRGSRLGSCEGDRPMNAQRIQRDPVRAVFSSLGSIWSSNTSRRTNMVSLAVVELTIFGIMMGLPSLQLAYSAYSFHWQPATQGVYMALVNSWSILVLVILFPLTMATVRRWARGINNANQSAVFNVGEVGAIRVSLVLQILGYTGLALTQVPGLFILSSLIVVSGSPVAPLLTSCLTAHVPEGHSGHLLGVLSFLHAIARVLVPAALNATYSMTIGWFPQAFFVLLAIVLGFLLLVSIFIKTAGS